MSTINIIVSQGVTYFMEIDVVKFQDLLTPDYTLTGQVRNSQTNELLASFNITKSPQKNKIYADLSASATKNLVINTQVKYGYDILAQQSDKIYKLVDGVITFKKTITSI